MSNRELTNSNLESLQLETPANLKSNVAKDEANVESEQGDASTYYADMSNHFS